MASTIGKVRAVFTASTSGLTAGVNAASGSMKRLQTDVAGLRSSMGALVAIQGTQLFASVVSGAAAASRAVIDLTRNAFAGLSGAVEQATTLGEETSKSGVIFGQAAGQVAAFAQSASAIGLSQAAALQATGSFGNLFTAMGLGQQQAAQYSTTLTALGADLASFNNATVEDAVQAVGAALRGESEPIRRFGVLLDDATLKQEALAAGLIKTTSGSLSPAIKAQAAYAAILKQTTAAQGDFERTSGSLANLGRVVQAQTANIFGDIGQAFEPLFQSALSAISQVLTAIRPFVQEVAVGVKSSIQVIGAALQNLVPAFTAFIGTFDGGSVGERIGNGILQGARFLAQIGDFIIQNFSGVFSYLSSIGSQWNTVFDFGNRVAQFFYGAFKTFEAVGNIVAAAILTAFSYFSKTAGEFAAVYSKAAADNIGTAQAAFTAAFTSAAPEAGQAIAGPLTTSLDAAIAKADAAAAKTDQAVKQTVEVKQTIDTTPINEAVKGIDSRSREGVSEMFRLMRGQGPGIEEQQLGVLEQIAANTTPNDLDEPVAEFAF
jgi:hypothetical protein